MKIANVETTTTIWEFDPILPRNWVLSDSLDVVAVVHALTIKDSILDIFRPSKQNEASILLLSFPYIETYDGEQQMGCSDAHLSSVSPSNYLSTPQTSFLA
ncbi:hypothetical protein BU15DRAFT_81972 [Melanogaster broomeanus]|nr:hypothetical protein BU15DRAFT_81972 [Melanogaster broomeanus]